MAEGELHEQDVVARLTAEGLTVTRQQEGVGLLSFDPDTWATFVNQSDDLTNLGTATSIVFGHLDGVVNGDPFTPSGPRVLEVKSMSQDAFKQFQAKGWYGDWPEGSLPDRYRWQLSIYMLATGLEALLVCKNRNSGEIAKHGIEQPYYSLDQITERVAYIEDHVSRGTLPDECPRSWFCDHKYLCKSRMNEEGDRELGSRSPDELGSEADESSVVAIGRADGSYSLPTDVVLVADAQRYAGLSAEIKVLEAERAVVREALTAGLAGRKSVVAGQYRVTWVRRETPERVVKASVAEYPIVKKIEKEESDDNAS